MEIQRLIGRAMRAVADMEALGERTLWLDCDVLQADGGTRCAGISARLRRGEAGALDRMGLGRTLVDTVAAVSVGIVDGVLLLDLDYVGTRARGRPQRRHDGQWAAGRGAGDRRGRVLARGAGRDARPRRAGHRRDLGGAAGGCRGRSCLSLARRARASHRLAAGLGAAIGLERELREREAGLRTHLLVSLGAALFTLVSAYGWTDWRFSNADGIVFDPTRIAAQIVTGVGFLGAGAIIRQGLDGPRADDRGDALGRRRDRDGGQAGYYSAAVLTTAVVLISLWPLRVLAFHLFRVPGPRNGRSKSSFPRRERAACARRRRGARGRGGVAAARAVEGRPSRRHAGRFSRRPAQDARAPGRPSGRRAVVGARSAAGFGNAHKLASCVPCCRAGRSSCSAPAYPPEVGETHYENAHAKAVGSAGRRRRRTPGARRGFRAGGRCPRRPAGAPFRALGGRRRPTRPAPGRARRRGKQVSAVRLRARRRRAGRNEVRATERSRAGSPSVGVEASATTRSSCPPARSARSPSSGTPGRAGLPSRASSAGRSRMSSNRPGRPCPGSNPDVWLDQARPAASSRSWSRALFQNQLTSAPNTTTLAITYSQTSRSAVPPSACSAITSFDTRR